MESTCVTIKNMINGYNKLFLNLLMYQNVTKQFIGFAQENHAGWESHFSNDE